eukprot:Gb_03407 [translate_table: standard]
MDFSSNDEDVDEEWKATVSSVMVDSTTILTNGFHQVGIGRSRMDDDKVEGKEKSNKLKLSQARICFRMQVRNYPCDTSPFICLMATVLPLMTPRYTEPVILQEGIKLWDAAFNSSNFYSSNA